jgi:hypothetical protein
MTRSFLHLLLLAACTSPPAATPAGDQARAPAPPCAFTTAPTVLVDAPASFLQVWEEPDWPELHVAALPDTPSLHAFRQEIAAVLDTSAVALLETQLPLVSGGDAENVRLVLSGEAGTIRPMTCLEGLLLAALTDRSLARGTTLFHDPTEFVAYVLEREGSLKVWFYTVDMAGVRGMGTLHEPVTADLQEGWSMVLNIHNHNVFPGAAMVLGGVAPSATDMQLYRNLGEPMGLVRASIVNGFHALEMGEQDLARFAGPPGA